MKNLYFFLPLLFLLIGCEASIKPIITNSQKKLTTNDKVAFLDLKHKIPSDVIKIGSAKFDDTGFSTDCDFNSNLIKARQIARDNGANIVKIVESKAPNLWSSCYRMKVEFYLYNGDVSTLQQYKIQIN